MPCEHRHFTAELEVRRGSAGTVASIRLLCKDCGEVFRFAGGELSVSRDGTTLRVPVATETYRSASGRIQCPHCNRFLTGKPADDAARLKREQPVAVIRCGPIHRVTFRDGAVVDVADGRTWVPEDIDGEQSTA